MRVPADSEIIAPEFPPELEWLNVAFLRVDKLLGRNVLMVEFWDFARVNSLRTLPYLKAWHERYSPLGLRVVGVHTSGYSFGRDRDTVARAVERLEIPYPVVLDTAGGIWRRYGNKGWPGRFLFDRRARLRHVHFGEGEYLDTELTVQELLREIDAEANVPEPLQPLRPEDAPGALLEPQTADISLPRDRERLELVRDWTEGEDYLEAKDAGAAAKATFTAGAAYAVLSGADLEPGVYESDGQVVAETPGVRLHGFQFLPRAPTRQSG
jgi:AhpC/TSA family protein